MIQSNIGRRRFLKHAGAAMAMGQRLWALPPLRTDEMAEGASAVVTYDARSLIFNQKRQLLISGELHYSRSTRAMWPSLLDRSKAMGLNCIATYVFWNVHEPQRDLFDFAGDQDLSHFLNLCKERQIHVFLRAGPYCCAEWNFGGYPPYLRDEPNITIRTMSPPYLERVSKYFERLALEVNPHLATRGGAVALIQVENEYANVAKRYGAQGQEYLRWMAELAKRVGFADVPTTMCEGAVVGPIATLNGMEITPKRIADFRTRNDHDPLLWTELYPAWYEVWGETRPADHDRDPRTIAQAILVFLANGGAGWNYYMWHGGTNFGRSSMYLQTTSYDFNAPLDEYGRSTFKGAYLGDLHKALKTYEDYLMQGERSSTGAASGEQRIKWTLRGRELSLLLGPLPDGPGIKDPHSLNTKIVDPDGKTVFDIQGIYQQLLSSWKEPAWSGVKMEPLQWHSWREPMPAHRTAEAIRSPQPIEQLLLTKDGSDYCWYSATIEITRDGAQELFIPYGGDFFYIYLDGKLAGQTIAPLKETRGANTPDDPAHPRIYANPDESLRVDGYRHLFRLIDVTAGSHRLDILATALGMVKGDWQIGSPMNFERKGIWEGVQLNGSVLNGWEMIPFLAGEKLSLLRKSANVQWSNLGVAQPLCWYKAEFNLPSDALTHDVDYRLDAAGLGKGMLFLNGHAVGRHWLIVSPGTNGQPTQQYYHLPKNWLESKNALVVFEEQSAAPSDVQLEYRSASVSTL